MNKLIINSDLKKGKINKNIYGHFSEHLGRCIYEGIWVGKDSSIPNIRGIRKDVLSALKKINIPVLRWPGGCFADQYHWKNGIGLYEDRPEIENNYWGGIVENNHFGTHEFLDLCNLLEAEPYITGNIGSGTVQEMQEWVEYITSKGKSPMVKLRKKNGKKDPWKLKFFGIGNENWGCGGNMRPEYYADLYRQYQTYINDYGDNEIYKIACGSYDDKDEWTEILMNRVGDLMDGLSLHYYTIPGTWENKGSATEFTEEEWFNTLKKTLKLDKVITRHSSIMDKYDPEKEIGIIMDEWGVWHNVEPGTHPRFLYQQNTLRDALVAAISLNIFNQHCNRVKMANIAQMVNVLQAVILTNKEEMLLTPTYHVFDMYKVHQNADLLDFKLICEDYCFNDKGIPAVSSSVSKNKEGTINITLCNLKPDDKIKLNCIFNNKDLNKKIISGKALTADVLNAHNTFENKDHIKTQAFENISLTEEGIEIELPSSSVVLLRIK